jgi:beta-xylosidase
LAMLQKHYGFIGVKRSGKAKSIVMVSAESDAPVEMQSVSLTRDLVFLRIDGDFEDRADQATFYYSLDGRHWQGLGQPLQMVYTLPHFMGYRFALFNFATKEAGGHVDFDYFRVDNRASATH